jgi:hypothetical protein
MGRIGGALIGALFFVWIAGTRALDPGEIGWLMRYDWPIHFFGWHFFRHEPWQIPPGLITSYYAPLGTSIGFTDSIPLAALSLKPFSAWLPATFQYIGPWLLICFTLQGLFAAWLASRWSAQVSVQLSAAALFVLMPVLLIRVGHPALCSHWLLLWALVVASRDGAARVRIVEWSAIGITAGLLHPYLAVMTLTLLAAVAAAPSAVPFGLRWRAFAAAVVTTVIGWWTAGLFSVSGAESLSTEGLGHYSMNVLAPITQTGWSLVLPDLPRATAGQDFEGFQYLGLGSLLLVLVALLVARFVPPAPAADARGASWRGFGSLLFLAALAMALFALSPKVTFANHLVIDLSGPWTERFAVFRATGRFFWPLAYLGLAWAIAVLCAHLPPRLALTILLFAVVVQAIDLHGAHEQRRQSARDPGFYAWATPMPSALWHQVLPQYRHLVLYPPPQCGRPPIGYEAPAYLAGLHGLTINAGGVARPDDAARLRYCHDLGDRVKAGHLDDSALYIVLPSEVEALRTVAQPAAVCGSIDQVSVCVTAASYQRWRDLAALQ